MNDESEQLNDQLPEDNDQSGQPDGGQSQSSSGPNIPRKNPLSNMSQKPPVPAGAAGGAGGASAGAGSTATAGGGAAAGTVGATGGATGAAAGGTAATGAAAGGVAAGGSAAAGGAAAAGGGTAAVGFFATPPGWIVIAIGIILLLFLFIYLKLGQNSDQNVTVRLEKSAPPNVKDKEPINYELRVSYTGSPTQIIVKDKIPDNTDYVSSGGPGNPTYDATTRTVTWTIPVSGGTGNEPVALGDNLPPNKDTCNGIYSNIDSGDHNGDNFGDPGCTLASSPRVSYDFSDPRTGTKHNWDSVPQALIDLLTRLDPDNVGYWIGIAACEAPGFDPNNRTLMVGDTRTPDAAGAWGLFQMGSHGPYTPGNGTNGQYDRGDVNWQNQVFNAVHDNRDRVIPGGNPPFRYYACARDVFGLWQ